MNASYPERSVHRALFFSPTWNLWTKHYDSLDKTSTPIPTQTNLRTSVQTSLRNIVAFHQLQVEIHVLIARKAVSDLRNARFISLMERRHYSSLPPPNADKQTSYRPASRCKLRVATASNYRCSFGRARSLRTQTRAWTAKTQSNPAHHRFFPSLQRCNSCDLGYSTGLTTWWVADTQ